MTHVGGRGSTRGARCCTRAPLWWLKQTVGGLVEAFRRQRRGESAADEEA